MPATKLKIDISFVRRIHTTQGAQLVTAIVQMARAFKLKTVAEGVEDEKTALALQGLGVALLQGYHFGKPMAAEDFERLFAMPPIAAS
jgi:EAL domain-containing protein (putative c-di-GMP-specific phosphodiesterase class I)